MMSTIKCRATGKVAAQVFALVPLATLNHRARAEDVRHGFVKALRAVQAEEQTVAYLQPLAQQLFE